jgi:hypothetical protein
MSGSSRRENISITPSYEFDLGEFNKLFEKNIEKQRKIRDEKLNFINTRFAKQTKLQRGNNVHTISISRIMTDFKNSMYDILDDLLYMRFHSIETLITVFTKHNRMFYIGILLVTIPISVYFISTLLYIVNKLLSDSKNKLTAPNVPVAFDAVNQSSIVGAPAVPNMQNVSNVSNMLNVPGPF